MLSTHIRKTGVFCQRTQVSETRNSRSILPEQKSIILYEYYIITKFTHFYTTFTYLVHLHCYVLWIRASHSSVTCCNYILKYSGKLLTNSSFHVTAHSVGVPCAYPGVEKQAQDAYVQEIVWYGLERHRMRTMTPNQPQKIVYLSTTFRCLCIYIFIAPWSTVWTNRVLAYCVVNRENLFEF